MSHDASVEIPLTSLRLPGGCPVLSDCDGHRKIEACFFKTFLAKPEHPKTRYDACRTFQFLVGSSDKCCGSRRVDCSQDYSNAV